MARRAAASDGYGVVELADFGGLDLRRDPQDASPVRAIDMLNVELENPGRIRSRVGTTKFVSQSTTTTWVSLATWVGLNPHIVTLAPGTGQLRSYNLSGTLVDTLTATGGAAARIEAATMIGKPDDDPRLYLNLTGGSFLIKYDGSDFTETAVTGGAKHMAVQYPDNRLVLANSGIVDTSSRVVFSAANDPETFDLTNDYVDLLPGDGEQIVGLANFREFLFAFKQSKFFRFYGNSTDSTGGTVFNYQTVHHDLHTLSTTGSVRSVVAGREGVYFLCSDGIYLTDGGYPRKVSAALDPLFRGGDNAGYFAGSWTTGPSGAETNTGGLYYAGGRLYYALGDGRILVYDPRLDAWMFWTLYAGQTSLVFVGATAVYDGGSYGERPFFLFQYSAGGGNTASVISYLDPSAITDGGHSVQPAFNSYYQTNFLDLGDAGTQKVVREIEVEGYLSSKAIGLHWDNARGSVSTTNFVQVTTVPPTGSGSATWPGYRVGRGRARHAYRGRNFSFAVGAASQSSNASWVLHRAMLHLRGQRAAGVSS